MRFGASKITREMKHLDRECLVEGFVAVGGCVDLTGRYFYIYVFLMSPGENKALRFRWFCVAFARCLF